MAKIKHPAFVLFGNWHPPGCDLKEIPRKAHPGGTSPYKDPFKNNKLEKPKAQMTKDKGQRTKSKHQKKNMGWAVGCNCNVNVQRPTSNVQLG